MPNLIGQSLGRYHILEQLGEGGMAVVYKAFDTRLETNVAVKVIRTERLSPEIAGRALQRFEREAKALAQLNHPNIVKVTDYGEYEGQPYLIMPYLEGGTLKELLHSQGALPWREAVRLILPIARALEYAHQHGTIHRDVKPSNILITDSGEPMLSDFGVAKIIDDEATVDLTGTSATVGTPEYMAPEQVISKSVDYRADIYALGVVFFEIVTGRRPFEADTPMAVLFKHASEPLPRPKRFVPSLPDRVEQVLLKALAKKPEDRYQKMGEFASALDGLLVAPNQQSTFTKKPADAGRFSEPPSSNQKPTDLYLPPVPNPGNRRIWWIGLGLVGLCVLVAAGILVGWLIGRKPVAELPGSGEVATSTKYSTPTQHIATINFPTLIPPKPTLTVSTATQPPAQTGPVQILWSTGIGTGADPAQVLIENDVVNDFNNSQNKIRLSIEVFPNESARNTISIQIAAGVGPDIVGPVGWINSNAFYGEWLDLAPYIKSTNYDINKFDPALAAWYQTDQGTVGFPFAVYPSAFFYNTGIFIEAGLNPPPSKYGDQYKMPDGTMVPWDWKAVAKVAKFLTHDKTGKNSTEAGFDPTNIVQYGFTFGYESHPNDWATFMSNGGSLLIPGGSKGSYAAKIPDVWKTAWQWVYDGMYGPQPYIPADAVASTADWGSGNPFNSGKVGMMDNPSWILSSMSNLAKAGGRFELGTMPIGLDGKVAGRVDADTFRVWKGTKHPAEAFTVLTYLIDTGIQKLVVGTPSTPPAYGAIPGIVADRAPWLASEQAAFPFVKNWDTLLAGVNYPDVPSAEAYMPNINEAWARLQTFGDLISSTPGIDLTSQEATLESDLTTIFNK